jgi:hypothetical protein
MAKLAAASNEEKATRSTVEESIARWELGRPLFTRRKAEKIPTGSLSGEVALETKAEKDPPPVSFVALFRYAPRSSAIVSHEHRFG